MSKRTTCLHPSDGNVEQRFLINDDRADTTTLSVKVQNSATDTTQTTFTQATDISGLTSTSNVYFIQEVEGGQYEIYFGDGILGSAIEDGNIIIMDYITCNRFAPNGASTFTLSGTIGGFSSANVTTIEGASGGADKESITSIN